MTLDLANWTLDGLIGGTVAVVVCMVLLAIGLLIVVPLVLGGGLLALVLLGLPVVLLAGGVVGLVGLVALPLLLLALVLGSPVLLLGALLWWVLRPHRQGTPRMAA